MTGNVFDAHIKAVDAATGPIRKIIAGMRDIILATRGVAKAGGESAKAVAHAGAKSAHAVAHAAHAVTKAGKEAEGAVAGVEKAEERGEAHHIRYFRALGGHVRLLKGHFGELNASIGEVGNSLKEFLPAIGALGAGASLVGMFELTHEAAETAIAFDATAQKIGITSNQLAGFNWAAKESGVSVESMDSGMAKLNRTIGMAAAGKSKDVASLFRHLGISLKDSNGHLRSSADLLPQLADAFAKTKDPAMRAYAATLLFGKAGQDMLPVLMKGKEGLEEMAAAGEKFADLGTDEQRERLKDFGHSWGEMDAAAEGFKTRLSVELAPALQPIVNMARDWIMANRDWIATGMANRVKELAHVVKGLLTAITNIRNGTESWAHALGRAARAHVGITAAVGGIMLVLASPFLTAMSSAGNAIIGFGRIIAATSVFLATNPLGWIIIAAAAIAAAAYEIYEHWDGIAAFFGRMWDSISAAWDAGWAKVKPIVDALKSAASWVKDSWVGQKIGGVMPSAETIKAMTPPAYNDGTMVDPGQTARDGQPALPNAFRPYGGLYREGGPAMQTIQGAQQQGQVNVKIDLANAPPGTRVTSSASGIAQRPETDVGYSNPMGDFMAFAH